MFYGPSGLGKTHLSVALGKRAIALGGYSVLFKEASKLFEELRPSLSKYFLIANQEGAGRGRC